ncbi:hypothetical protein C4K22_2175 [Pseudomonas chlororaphis subsp. aurantiaca]|nr:hypothetical protein C4K22_2175 [Pseudomonas chlororaphis subsp. aurantiaca]AZD41258.1 hypothetical protein C4K21_2179 [Pseudomonas chlororaphis subsp. aurantiaca]AZD47491.1 hypothetical protein C4K20_2071 [Pseudomonas chlororaphis subsp. aurantiaca]AZD72408.1 hypothetical protein C4K16_2043 [Pseudomonas chlororaphis subsp. aurantiaca]AZD78641.1 hypothetical protein C4K15_2069 [Pseudomonas chlororaphis subsp. aurantiaca]
MLSSFALSVCWSARPEKYCYLARGVRPPVENEALARISNRHGFFGGSGE